MSTMPVILDHWSGFQSLGGKDIGRIDPNIKEIFDQMIYDVLKNAIPQDTIVKTINYDEIVSFFKDHVDESFIISLLPPDIYTDIKPDFSFSSSRFYSSIGDIIKKKSPVLLQRDGTVLENQYAQLIQHLSSTMKKKIIILDDGLASGSSIKPIIDIVKKTSDKELQICVAMNFSGLDCFDGNKIIAHTSVARGNLYDALEARDLFPGLPQSGASIHDDFGIWGQSYTHPQVAVIKSSILSDKANAYYSGLIDIYQKLLEVLNLKDISLYSLGRKSELHKKVSVSAHPHITLYDALGMMNSQ